MLKLLRKFSVTLYNNSKKFCILAARMLSTGQKSWESLLSASVGKVFLWKIILLKEQMKALLRKDTHPLKKANPLFTRHLQKWFSHFVLATMCWTNAIEINEFTFRVNSLITGHKWKDWCTLAFLHARHILPAYYKVRNYNFNDSFSPLL